MIILDSSFLVALFHEGDALHGKALEDVKVFESLKERFVICDHVLGETATALLYNADMARSKAFIDYALENYDLFLPQKDDLDQILEIFLEQKKEISVVDASVVYLARNLHGKVACYDKNVLKQIESK
jgi:predicted nucleic acid-binding protein